jgi:hypothetical protein
VRGAPDRYDLAAAAFLGAVIGVAVVFLDNWSLAISCPLALVIGWKVWGRRA